MIKVHNVIVGHQGFIHQMADQVSIVRNLNIQCVFHCATGRQCMSTGTDTTDTFNERPGITWITAFQNHFQTTPHSACGNGVTDNIVAVDVYFAAHVTFNPGYRIDHHAAAIIVELAGVQWDVHAEVSSESFLLDSRLMALTAAWAAMAAPTPPATAVPISSAFFSIPNW